jgi:hypothetical protein
MQSKGRFRLFLFPVIALLVFSTAAITTLHSSTSVRAATSLPTGLHVVGNQIQDGSGHVFVSHGVNRMGTEYACNTSGANASYDGTIAPGSTLSSIGFLGTWNGANTVPASFTLNGTQCS